MPTDLNREDLADDPLTQFQRWFDEAVKACELEAAQAMCLSTINPKGVPEARTVLLKEVSQGGFVFYTNTLSPKGKSLASHPHAALNFYWHPLKRQVCIEGPVTRVTDAEADAYFASRPRGSQIGAWASNQSEPLDKRETLEKRVEGFTKKFEGKDVPRPSHWSGYRITPEVVEFWQGRVSRLHDRFLYSRQNSVWRIQRLFP
jgi:pyridoxamine 5'-phosphate oxidase